MWYRFHPNHINVGADIILLPSTIVAYFVAIVLVKEVVLDELSTDKFVYFIHITMCYSFIVFNYGQILAYSTNMIPPGHSNCGLDVGCTWNGMHGWPAKMFSEEIPGQIVLGDSRLLRRE